MHFAAIKTHFLWAKERGAVAGLWFYGVQNLWITLLFNDPARESIQKGKRERVHFLLALQCVSHWPTAESSLLTPVKVLLQAFTTYSDGWDYFATRWPLHTGYVFYDRSLMRWVCVNMDVSKSDM